MLLKHNPDCTWVAVMTDFSLYLDDGGHPDDQPFLVVAGYVATESQWLAFEQQWKDALARFSLGDAFHMTDFMSQRRSAIKQDQILSTLASIIKNNGLHPFVAAIDIAAYKRVNEEFALEECIGAPFAYAGRTVARHFSFWKAKNLQPADNLLVFVEQGTKHFGDLEQVFKRDRLPLINRVPKAIAPVQAADLLAWETFNWLRAGSPKRMGKNLDRLTRHIRVKQELGGIVYEADMRKICADVNVYLRSELNPGDTIAFHHNRKRKRKRTIKGPSV
jgi:hypothetical protein